MFQEELPKHDSLRILVISEHYYPIKGGSVTHVHNLCNSLAKSGISVYLVTSTDGQTHSRWEREGLFYVHRLNISKHLRKERYFPIYLSKELPSILSEIQPDVIHIAYGFFAPISLKLLDTPKTPLVWTVHNVPPAEHIFNMFQNDTVNGLFQRMYFKAVSVFSTCCFRYYNYDKIICVSESTGEKVLRKGAPHDKICIVPNGVLSSTNVGMLHYMGKKVDSLAVLTVGGIVEHKGQLEVVKAAPYILKKFPKIKFIFVGPIRSPAYLEAINSTIESFDIQNHIQITGEVSEKELHEYYAMCDVYIQPSLQEGFCITIMEAMAHGKPVVGAAVGAIPDLVGDERGILLKDLSVESISQALTPLLENADLRDIFGERGKEYILDTFSWEKVARETRQLYQDLLLAHTKQ